jgi:hypothetical protein
MKPPLFHVGQAVVLIHNPGSAPEPFEQYPKRGPIYHVREAIWDGEIWGLLLAEVSNPIANYNGDIGECSFWEDLFAPVEHISDEAITELLEEVFTPVHA